jgi:hypothetical protein
MLVLCPELLKVRGHFINFMAGIIYTTFVSAVKKFGLADTTVYGSKMWNEHARHGEFGYRELQIPSLPYVQTNRQKAGIITLTSRI